MVFNATFNNISVILWRSVLLVEENGVPGENHWPVASHWQTCITNITDHHDITEILLKVALNTINQNPSLLQSILQGKEMIFLPNTLYWPPLTSKRLCQGLISKALEVNGHERKKIHSRFVKSVFKS